MANNPNLRVRISADLADIKQGLAVLRGDLAKVKKESDRAAPSTSGWKKGLSDIRTQLASIVSVYAAMRGVGWYTQQADDAANLSARLRLATKSQDEFNRAQKATYQIAQQTSSEWGAIVGLYSQLAKTTGMSQDNLVSLTRTVSQAFQVSGASAQEAANGLRQLQQAMAGGVLRAEEFNTIIETSPRIVQALADYYGIAFGQVRKYVNDGKITSEQFADAMLKASSSVQEDFNKLPLTVSRSTQQVRNALLGLVGDADTASGAASNLATGIQDLARLLESPEVKQGFATFVGGVVTATTKLAEMLATTVNVTKFIAEEIAARLHGPNSDDLVRLDDAIKRDEKRLEDMRKPGTGKGLNNVVNTDAYAKHYAEIERRLEQNRASYEAAFEALTREVKLPEPTLPQQSTSGAPVAPTSKAGKAVAASNALLRDSVTRALAELDRLYAENEIGMREYFATRMELQQQSIDLQIAQAQAELAITKDAGKRQKLEEQIIILQRDRADIATKAAREQKKAEEELAKALGDVHLKLMEMDGRTGAAERAKLEAEYQQLFKQLDAASDEAGRKMVENLIDRLVAKAQGDELKLAGEKIASALQGKEASIGAQVAGGMLGYSEGERQVAAARAKAIVDLQALRVAANAALADMKEGTPEHAAVLAGIDAIDVQIANVTASQQVFKQKMEDIATSSFGDFLADLTTGVKSFKAAFADMVKSFVAGVARMIAQELALRAIKSMFGTTGAAAGVAHTGGVAGRISVKRRVSPLLFGHAPRYHSGGIAGLKPDEVPAILQTGERVLSRRQTAMYDATLAAGAGASRVTTPVVAIGDDAVANALAGAAGEDVVLTHVRNNWEGLARGG